MLKNYLKIAVRNIVKQKTFSFVIIFGFSLGLACFLLILSWGYDELSYDRFHEEHDQKYRLSVLLGMQNQSARLSTSASMAGPTLTRDFPEVEEYLRLQEADTDTIVKYRGEKEFEERSILWSDSNFFSMFGFELDTGNPETALSEPNSAVVTRRIAQKYFDNDDPIGKVLQIGNKTYQVTGILKETATKSHIEFDFLLTLSTLKPVDFDPNWVVGNMSYYTYFKVVRGTDIEALEDKMIAAALKAAEPIFKQMGVTGIKLDYTLLPLADIHFTTGYENYLSPPTDINSLYLFLAVGLLILFIATFNYINLTVAKGINRRKEIGIRKVVGAKKSELVKQFLVESFLHTSISFIFALVIAASASPLVSDIAGKNINIDLKSSILFPLILALVLLVLTIISGIYPAYVLARGSSASLITDRYEGRKKKPVIRRIFVIAQFVIGIALICIALFVSGQVKYMKTKDLGFNKNNKLVVRLNKKEESQKYEVLKNELLKNESILNASGSITIPGRGTIREVFFKEGSNKEQKFGIMTYWADSDFVQALELDLIKGRNFSKDVSSDDAAAVILSETAVKELELEKPIGATIYNNQPDGVPVKCEVIGVVKDFHSESLQKKIWPSLIRIFPKGQFPRNLVLNIDSENVSNTLANVEKTYSKVFPDGEFEYLFLSELFASFYSNEENLNILIAYSSGIAVFLACLGTLGLVAFVIKKRTKEIGIRKILGSTVPDIVKLLVRDHLYSVILANLIAWPIAYYVIGKWLENYPYRMDIGMGIFFVSGLAVLLIAMITISFYAVKAALANPVDALRYE